MLSYLAFVLLISSVADQQPDSNLVLIDPIIVVAKREPLRLSKIVNSAIVLTPEKVSSLSENNIISHLNSSYASVSVSQSRLAGYGLGTAGKGKLLIRGLGFSPNRGTLVTIDGRPEIAGLFGHPLPDTYRSAGVSSAELVKGAASTLYGSNAMAGVLDLQSFYRPDKKRYTDLRLSGGKHNTYNSIVRHSQRIGAVTAAGWFEYLESENQSDNNDYLNRSGGFRLQYEKSNSLDIFLSGKFSSFDFVDPGPDYALARMSGDIKRSGLTLGLDKQSHLSAVQLRFYSSYGEHEFSDGFNSVDRNNGATIFMRRNFMTGDNKLILSGGGSFDNLGGSAGNNSPAIKKGSFSQDEYGAHAQLEYRLDKKGSFTAGTRLLDNEIYGGHLVYQLGAVFYPTPNSGSLKLSVATAYRNPTISETELLPPRNNESLEPEEGTFYEVGYFKTIGSALSVEAAVFWREGESLIQAIFDPSIGRGVFVNSGSYSHSGWEMLARFNYKNWLLVPSFIHLNQNEFNSSVPEDKLVLDNHYISGQIEINIQAVAAWKTSSLTSRLNSGGSMILDDYLFVNLNGRYTLSHGVSLQFRVDNLFDKDYQIVDGYPMPGRVILGGLRYELF